MYEKCKFLSMGCISALIQASVLIEILQTFSKTSSYSKLEKYPATSLILKLLSSSSRLAHDSFPELIRKIIESGNNKIIIHFMISDLYIHVNILTTKNMKNYIILSIGCACYCPLWPCRPVLYDW